MTGKGGYVVGFTVHEAKELSRDGSTVDPLCVIRSLGREYKTDLKRNKLALVKFEESFIWSDIQLTPDEYQSAFIDFDLQSANVFTRNDTIGSGKVQLSMVRRRPNHTYVKKWIQLSSDTMKTAKLLVTVFSYGEGDDPPRPEDLENDVEETQAQLKSLNAAVLNTDVGNVAHTFTTGYHLFCHVHRAEHLGGGAKTYDPYVTVEFAGNTLLSPQAKDTHTVAWDDCFRLPVTMPLFSDSIIIRVWNKKSWGHDEIIVQGRLSFSLIRTHALAPKWFNFYGFNSEEVPDLSSIMSTGERPEPNAYQGRILVSARAQKVAKETDLFKPASIKGMVQEEPASMAMNVLCDVFEVSGCPGKEVYVHICYGRSAKKIKPQNRHKDSESMESDMPGIFRFSTEKGSMAPMNIVMPANPEQQLDLIVSIYAKLDGTFDSGKHQRVGFKRIKMKNIASWSGEATAPRWISCKPMAHLPSSIDPGAVLCSLYKSQKVDLQRTVCQVRVQKFQLRVYACMARGLVSSTVGHQPSAFLNACCAGESKSTEVMDLSSEPNWSECLNLPIRLQVATKDSKAYPEPVQLTVYDHVGDLGSFAEQLKNKIVGNEEDSEDDDKQQRGKLAASNEDNFAIATRLGQQALDAAVDHVGVMRGDIMAKKRLGNTSQGRQVIGRTQVNYNQIRHPRRARSTTMNQQFKPKWLKIQGGMMGNTHAGDILVAFELLKKKHAVLLPERDFQVPMHRCSLFVAVLGLRNVEPITGGTIKRPIVKIAVKSSGYAPSATDLEWEKKPPPESALTKEDTNRKWELYGKQGFEFIEVVHLPVFLPTETIWAPSINFLLVNQQDETTQAFIGDGSLSLAHNIPWSDPEETQYQMTAHDTYSDSDDEGPREDGVVVSEDEEDLKKIMDKQYLTVKIANEAMGVTFNDSDKKSFPPKVLKVQLKSAVEKSGVQPQDWLIGVKIQSENEKSMVFWTPAQVTAFLADIDKRRIRPVHLRFRRVLPNEVTVPIKGEDALGFELEKVPQPPPKFLKDNTRSNMYSKHAIDPGWHLVSVNGNDTSGMSGVDPRLKAMMKKRPCVLTFRGDQETNVGTVVHERAKTEGKPVQLNGLPKELDPKKFSVTASQAMAKKLGPVKFSRVPKPTPVLANVTDLGRLNLHPARNATLDVRGMIKAMFGMDQDADGMVEDEGADHSRPSVRGTLENNPDCPLTPYFTSVTLTNGGVATGTLKVRVHVIEYEDPDWPSQLPDAHNGTYFYNPKKFRKWIKQDTPAVFRIRSYVIRGINVSGSKHGYGNPYLFFVYGQMPVKLPGQVEMKTVEPRFFRTEERDVKMPEQSNYEVGMYDLNDAGFDAEDEMIGKSVIDLEDRWFSREYQLMMRQQRVPIEYRPVLAPKEGSLCKGSLEMWIDMMDAASAGEVPLSPLRAPPPVEIEIRVVIWKVRDCSLRLCYDDQTGEPRNKVDMMVKCSLDCRTMNGKQSREQESDVHHGSDGDAEFNWRFVFSKIAVTKGVPLDCFLQLSLAEHFTLARPKLMCEALVEMRNYCKKVALTGDSISIDAELPLENQKLKHQLMADRSRGTATNLDDDDDASVESDAPVSDDGEEDKVDPDGMNAHQGEDAEDYIPPAGTMKLNLQVYTQVEANTNDLKVGLGRDEPNRLPTLLFPTTGRSWQSVLPSALAAVEAAMEAYSGGTKRVKWLLMFAFFVFLIVGLHAIPGQLGCKLVQQSCKDVCACCSMCHDPAVVQASFCIYRGMPEVANCAEGTMNAKCKCPAGHGSCSIDGIQPRIAGVAASANGGCDLISR